eukprot:CAMPEP_0171220570 /NCGR_PEP_ID=MMETSP0790-20130122/34311_1 /TAXON_ID=2925 /ORGANISM="Alexandrium catenella, Strain OF101" /LENGTH=158 /DNA_ID=CAMNT_0011686479 /DNA_START=160 /DNA_END=634 /DNA_ORIENTATION=+
MVVSCSRVKVAKGPSSRLLKASRSSPGDFSLSKAFSAWNSSSEHSQRLRSHASRTSREQLSSGLAAWPSVWAPPASRRPRRNRPSAPHSKQQDKHDAGVAGEAAPMPALHAVPAVAVESSMEAVNLRAHRELLREVEAGQEHEQEVAAVDRAEEPVQL